MDLNSERLILLPPVDSKANYLDGFWRWVGFLANDDYQKACEALYSSRGSSWKPDELKMRITTFFGEGAPWSVVVPNERLIGVINNAAEYEPQNKDGWGWFMAQIPLTTQLTDSKNDEIPLMGLATSFFVRQYEGRYVLEFEIFHV